MRSVVVVLGALAAGLAAGTRRPVRDFRPRPERAGRRTPLGRSRLRRREAARLVEELPDALDQLAAALRAGSSLLVGLEAWGRGPGPLAADSRRLVRQVGQGARLEDALTSWRRQRDLAPVSVTVAALRVGAEDGGRSASAIEGLAQALRDAADSRAEVAAQSAQGRLSALVIGAAPAGSVAVAALVDPRVPAVLVGTGPGRVALAGGLTLMALAAWWMARILRVPE